MPQSLPLQSGHDVAIVAAREAVEQDSVRGGGDAQRGPAIVVGRAVKEVAGGSAAPAQGVKEPGGDLLRIGLKRRIHPAALSPPPESRSHCRKLWVRPVIAGPRSVMIEPMFYFQRKRESVQVKAAVFTSFCYRRGHDVPAEPGSLLSSRYRPADCSRPAVPSLSLQSGPCHRFQSARASRTRKRRHCCLPPTRVRPRRRSSAVRR